MLTFVVSEDRYSVYLDEHGHEVYLAHGTRARLTTTAELLDDLPTLWAQWESQHWNMWIRAQAFVDSLQNQVIDPDDLDDAVSICEDCATPVVTDDYPLHWTGDETNVCDSCIDYYSACYRCEDIFRNTTTTLDDTEVCERCRDNYYSWCDYCDGYRSDDDYDHDHTDYGCMCESPAQRFSVRNDGEEPLPNDTFVSVTLPSGVISQEGIDAIRDYLRDATYGLDDLDQRDAMWRLAYSLDALGDQWQTREGNYTKRLSRMAYKSYGLKLAPAVVSQVGCIARDHSTSVDFTIDVTRDLNLPPEEFAHEDSCWWQSYYEGRCALKSNGGFGLRTHTDYGVTGRAWVMPLRRTASGDLTPTFDSLTPDAFVVFNGYGNLSGYTGARVFSHMAGMTYRKVSFTCSPMYVNSDAGYLVAPEEIAADYTDGSLHLSVDQHADLHATEHANERELTHV